jgi:hypothetical protein
LDFALALGTGEDLEQFLVDGHGWLLFGWSGQWGKKLHNWAVKKMVIHTIHEPDLQHFYRGHTVYKRPGMG